MKIKIDNNKCKNPDKCMKCVQVCPAKVFILKPIIEKKSSNAGGVEIKVVESRNYFVKKLHLNLW